MQKAEQLAVIYLGTRGGGSRLLRDIYLDFKNSGQSIKVFFKKNSEFSDQFLADKNSFFQIELPKNNFFRFIFIPYFAYKNVVKIKHKFPSLEKVVFVMEHPYNKWFITFLTYKKEIFIVSVLHDRKSHKGQFWPTKRMWTTLIKKSDRVIFLSEYVMKGFEYQEKFIKSKLQVLRLLEEPLPERDSNLIIVPGRIRRYKNIKSVLKFAKYIDSSQRVLIMGESKYKLKTMHPRVDIINKWFNATDFEFAIASSGALLNIYSEASQSGPIAIAMAYNIPIISNGQGGILEQISAYPYKLIISTRNQSNLNLNDFISQGQLNFCGGKFSPELDVTEKIIRILEEIENK